MLCEKFGWRPPVCASRQRCAGALPMHKVGPPAAGLKAGGALELPGKLHRALHHLRVRRRMVMLAAMLRWRKQSGSPDDGACRVPASIGAHMQTSPGYQRVYEPPLRGRR